MALDPVCQEEALLNVGRAILKFGSKWKLPPGAMTESHQGQGDCPRCGEGRAGPCECRAACAECHVRSGHR